MWLIFWTFLCNCGILWAIFVIHPFHNVSLVSRQVKYWNFRLMHAYWRSGQYRWGVLIVQMSAVTWDLSFKDMWLLLYDYGNIWQRIHEQSLSVLVFSGLVCPKYVEGLIPQPAGHEANALTTESPWPVCGKWFIVWSHRNNCKQSMLWRHLCIFGRHQFIYVRLFELF